MGNGSSYPQAPGPIPSDEQIPLWVADMDFACPPQIPAALRVRADHGIFGYSLEPEGYREAVVSFMQRRHGLEVSPRDIVSAAGVMPIVRAAVDAFTEPGEGVVVQPPVYFPFYMAVRDKGRRLIYNPLLLDEAGRYRMNLAELEQQFRNGARLLLLCSPHNPVARVWRRDELQALSDLAAAYDVRIVSDEIHCDIIMPGYEFTSILHLDGATVEKAVVSRSPSKTFNIPGIAESQAICREGDTRRRLKAALGAAGHALTNPLGAAAASAAYREGDAWLDELIPYLDANARYLRERLEGDFTGIGMAPHEGSFVAWLDFRNYLASAAIGDSALKDRLRRRAGVWLSDGPSFGPGGRGFQRLNIATPRSVLSQALDRMREVL
ncbi:MAG: putative C-S lyase [Spirochaetes bacterium]|nr:putative C-S lyase [Spirochaetota bacterium]